MTNNGSSLQSCICYMLPTSLCQYSLLQFFLSIAHSLIDNSKLLIEISKLQLKYAGLRLKVEQFVAILSQLFAVPTFFITLPIYPTSVLFLSSAQFNRQFKVMNGYFKITNKMRSFITNNRGLLQSCLCYMLPTSLCQYILPQFSSYLQRTV